ncbi:MAG: rRNA maturation RNase YbeY [Holophagales bacterium]|nr:rRNA maturation RNase YbeY [Holophagales bacterium]
MDRGDPRRGRPARPGHGLRPPLRRRADAAPEPEFRKIDRPTDVLSFPAGDPAFLGDVAVDVPYAARQAARRGHSLDREVKLLLAHGVLHLLGHDHETDEGEMFRLQSRLVRKVFGPGPDGVPGDEA